MKIRLCCYKPRFPNRYYQRNKIEILIYTYSLKSNIYKFI